MRKPELLFSIGIFTSAILIIFCIESMLSAYQHSNYTERLTSAENSLSKLKQESNEVFALQKELNYFYGLLSESKIGSSNSELSILCTDFFEKGYDFVNIRFFDKNKNKITIKRINEKDKLNGAMQRLYTALATSKLNNDKTLLNKYRSLFEVLLGAVDLDQLSEQSSTLLPVTLSGKPGYFYWNIYEDSANNNNISGLVAWIKQSDIPFGFFRQKLVEKYNETPQSVDYKELYGFIDTSKNGFIYPESKADAETNNYYTDISQKLQELKASLKSHGTMGDYIFSYIDLGNDQSFYCLSLKPVTITARIYTAIFEIILLIVSTCASCFAIKQNLQNKTKNGLLLSEKAFLITNLLFATLLTIFLAAANLFISQLTTKIRKDMVYASIYSTVDWINEGYTIAKKELSQKWLEVSKEQCFIELDKEKLTQTANALCQSKKLTRMFLTDKEGKILFDYPKSDKSSIFNKFIPVIARKISMEQLTSEESWQNKIDSLMLDSVSKSFTELLGENANKVLKAFENYNAASEFEFGNKRHIVFSTVIQNTKEPVILITWLDSEIFCEDYFLNKIKDSETLPDNLKETLLAMVPIQLDKPPYPKEIVKYSFARNITDKVAFTKRPIDFATSLGGQDFLGVGTLLDSIPNYVIFALQREEQ